MKFPYGVSNFEKLRTEGYFYVDKTRYIEVLEQLAEDHIVILRSRRFGKTLFANMLGWYYDRLHADQFEKIFKGTYIYDHSTPQRSSYMMLTFNFSGINTETLENANQGFLGEVRSSVDVFLGHYSPHFSTEECQEILQKQKPNDIVNELFKKVEKKELGRCVYVIIDEYDHFANNILSQGKEMFKDLVKTDGYVRPYIPEEFPDLVSSSEQHTNADVKGSIHAIPALWKDQQILLYERSAVLYPKAQTQ